MVKEGITMDFHEHEHGDEKTAAVITQLVEILGHISNALGTGIDFTTPPITKKPTSKKVDVGGQMFNDEPLGNKSLPRMAAKPNNPQSITKAPSIRYTGKDFTGSSLNKEDIDEVVAENMAQHENTEKILPLLVAGAGALINNNDDENKAVNAMSTSEGKDLLTTLEEAVKKLEKYLNTTRISSKNALKPQDARNENF